MKLDREHPLFGKCYVVAELLWHATGKRLQPMQARYKGVSHWWLEGPDGEIIDPTVGQFVENFPYVIGRPRAFLTKNLSKRTKEFISEASRN